MPLGTEVGLGPDNIVLHGDPAPPSKNGAQQPPTSGLTTGWIKMPLDMEVSHGPGDIVLDGNPAPPNSWMDEDATWFGSRPRPRQHCVTWGPSSPLQKQGTAAPTSGLTGGWIKMPLGMEVGHSPGDRT